MPTKPWVTFRRPDPGREYLALLTDLPLRRIRHLPGFVLHTLSIAVQLRRTPGLLGYSFLARVLRMRFWTLSVWEDEAALGEFVRRDAHREARLALAGRMGRPRFVRWKVPGSRVPPSWRDALERTGDGRGAELR